MNRSLAQLERIFYEFNVTYMNNAYLSLTTIHKSREIVYQ